MPISDVMCSMYCTFFLLSRKIISVEAKQLLIRRIAEELQVMAARHMQANSKSKSKRIGGRGSCTVTTREGTFRSTRNMPSC